MLITARITLDVDTGDGTTITIDRTVRHDAGGNPRMLLREAKTAIDIAAEAARVTAAQGLAY